MLLLFEMTSYTVLDDFTNNSSMIFFVVHQLSQLEKAVGNFQKTPCYPSFHFHRFDIRNCNARNVSVHTPWWPFQWDTSDSSRGLQYRSCRSPEGIPKVETSHCSYVSWFQTLMKINWFQQGGFFNKRIPTKIKLRHNQSQVGGSVFHWGRVWCFFTWKMQTVSSWKVPYKLRSRRYWLTLGLSFLPGIAFVQDARSHLCAFKQRLQSIWVWYVHLEI